jgi:L-ribulose-5-phosphate 3-epimerase
VSFLKNKVGVMQGRLVPKYMGRYQAHPKDFWRDEFRIASDFGLDSIEFILDYNDADENPLLTQDGIDEIKAVVDETGVEVKSICADYFMEAPLHSDDLRVSTLSQKVISKLVKNAADIGVTDIVIPCVDKSSINESSISTFVNRLSNLLDVAENNKINISLETDLPPKSFLSLLDLFNSKYVTVNYDIGNSASLGYNPVEELNCYGHRITDIHIKDRILNGGPVMLGQGDANFDIFFRKLKDFNYKGQFIMQAFRDDEGQKVFKQQLDWIMPYLKKEY